jgi:hypothetical protein
MDDNIVAYEIILHNLFVALFMCKFLILNTQLQVGCFLLDSKIKIEDL